MDGPLLVALMLNPSKADDTRDDPTTVQMCGRAFRLGFPRYQAVNMFALVDTNPEGLREALDPIGPETDAYIKQAAEQADKIILAYGCHPMLKGRIDHVLDLLPRNDLWCLGTNKDGSPRFPRAISKNTSLVQWTAPIH